MREVHGFRKERPRAKLVRDASGRISAKDERDIGDVWADLDRARLQAAIDADKKRKAQKARLDPKGIRARIKVPKLKMPKISRLRASKAARKRILAGGIVCGVLALFIGSFSLYGDAPEQAEGPGGYKIDSGDVQGASNGPDYQTLAPFGKSIMDDLGGWARVSPEGADPVYAYVDHIGDIQINVSQQPLPERFKTNTDAEVLKLAEQFSASRALNVGSATAYIGRSQFGPQSVILAKEGLLILIKSASQVSDDKWIEYITALQKD